MRLALNKEGWSRFRFDEIAQKISKTVNPAETELERYIGLEHIDAEDIHIRRWGSPSDVKGGKLLCYPGDIIFGKRRAYQRKAAIVEEESICSAHAFVFRAIEEVILPEFLPFFLHSDSFMNRMVDISVGGLSPTINWGDLKHQEFLLPPKDQQAELAELLWAMNNAVEQNLELKNSLSNFFERMKNDSVTGKLFSNSKNWKDYVFGSLGNSFGGLSGKTKNDFGEGKPFINYMNVFSNAVVNPSQFDKVRIGNNEKQNEIKFGDILFTGSSETPEEVGMASVVLDYLSGYYLNSFCFGFRLNDFEILRPEYAKHLMRSAFVRQFMTRRAQGSTRFNISKSVIKEKLKIVLPETNEQLEIAATLDSIESSIVLLDQKISESKTLHKSIINQIF